MAEYIDRDALLAEAKRISGPMTGDGWDNWGVYALINRQPAADVIERKKGKWIPVTERLPEHLTSVIVHRKDGGIFIWEYFDTSPTDECWIDDSMNIYSFYDVAHWMPLPEPPKEE